MSENIGKWAQKLDLAFNDLWVLRFATVGALCVAVLFLLPASSLLADVVSWGGSVAAKAGAGFYTKVDLGIAKYHFEIGAGTAQFRWAP